MDDLAAYERRFRRAGMPLLIIQRPPRAVAGQSALSIELLKVSSGLAAFSGVYYSISVLSDSAYRAEFQEGFERSLRETFEDRARYLRLRAAQTPA